MEIMMVYIKITLRVFSILALLLFLVMKTGRRKIGEMPVFDFLAVIIIGSVVGADIADPNIEHLPTAYAVVLIVGIQYFLSKLIIKNRKIGAKVTFGPVVVIQEGQFVKENLKRLHYTIDDIKMFLREKEVFDLNEVEYAIVEDSGKMSVMKKSQFLPLTPSDMKLPTNKKGLSIPLIVDSKVMPENLTELHLDENWLLKQLNQNGIKRIEDVFYLEINPQKQLYISRIIQVDDLTDDVTIV
jgi:uncharacterized membrane protein YcaP (DUF421 family)